jgi:hypothetical protein
MSTRMNRAFGIFVLGFASLCTFSANAASWSTKTVSGLQPFYVSSNCYYFSLEGVSEADPAVPGSLRWIAPLTLEPKTYTLRSWPHVFPDPPSLCTQREARRAAMRLCHT